MDQRPSPTRKKVVTPAVTEAKKRATIPTRPVIRHTSLFRAELQAALNRANGALLNADNALSVAADDRDAEISLANQRFDAIRAQIDAERDDILNNIAGIEAALAATAPKDAGSNVEPIRQPVEVAA